MVSIDNSGNITINRGDTFVVPLFIDASPSIFHSIRFTLREGDIVYLFLVEPNTSIKRALVKQIYKKEDSNSNGDILLKFANQDTNFLSPGVYYYEIKLQRKLEKGYQDILTTICPRRKFIVL